MKIGLDATEARILKALLRVDTPLAGRAVSRIVGESQSSVQRALTRLRENGLVAAEPAPPSLLYRPNTEHLAMPSLRALLHLDLALRTRMGDEVASWKVAPVTLVVYGSVARGEAIARSDLDVLLVRPDATDPDDAIWQRQVTALVDRVRRWSGRHASVVEMNRTEAVDGLAERQPFLLEADRDGWVVAGRRLRELGSSGA